ncbi:hypothetical protein [uncultured Acetobacterium sp.]|jgi:predicted amidohydrolase|uniref:hypothetical protein n=1 Tax=uncultured Acetobacterium sp. TaxID=217139 RepID=UPI0025CC8347|nr:hypothetical protein [uncultured Acetobacterium sp.]
MFLEERLEAIERKQAEIITQNAEIIFLLKKAREPMDSYLSAKDFAKKADISYAAARRLINKCILPDPICIRVNGRDKINWKLYCEWLAIPGNTKKLEKI